MINNELVMITGAGGYLGKSIMEEFDKQNIEYVAIDLKQSSNVLKLDISKITEADYVRLGSPTKLLHLAWRDGFIHNSEAHFEDLSSHYIFLNKMIKFGVKQLTILGTMHELGYVEGVIDETTTSNPTTLYGLAKDSLRKSIMIEHSCSDITIQWIRAFYIIGDAKRGNSVFSKIYEAALSGQKKFPFTSGENEYDFISISELSNQIVEVVKQKEVNGLINCCSGNPVTLKSKVEEFIKVYELDIELEYGAYPDRAYDSPVVYGDRTKIDKILEGLK
uniref:NAD(P)-dependent oxidoreductase n=1 Tax=Erysipelothrix tonsillarum TaxID=38402 RepID=A0A6S6I2Q6_9FIRM|nr:NAD(P)-dependent oxidoreductase [Erysipelothrix tonsillarum]